VPNVKLRLTIEFDQFAWERINEEADRQRVTPEEIVRHAAMYYMADLDSGRVAMRVLREESPSPAWTADDSA
jgi:hypothetical protein